MKELSRCGWQWTTRAREYRFPRIERTESCSSGRQFLRVTTRAPWQLMSMVGAISDDGLSGLLNFTNIFRVIRCSFRLRSGVRSTISPLGREVQHQHPTAGALEHNGTKGQSPASESCTPEAPVFQPFCITCASLPGDARTSAQWKEAHYGVEGSSKTAATTRAGM